MKSFFITSWNVLKILLIHSFVGMPYMVMATFIHTFIWGISQNNLVPERLEYQLERILSIQMQLTMIVAGFAAFFIYKIMIARKQRDIFKVCRFKKLSWDKVLISFVAGIAFVSLSSLILYVLGIILPSALESHHENMQSLERGGILLMFLSVGLMAPFIEEVMFRGIIFDELESKMSLKLTVLIQGLLFGVYHLNIAQGLYASIMGLVLGLILIWTGSIWAPILIHLGNNLFSIVLTQLPENMEDILVLFLIASFIILPLCILYLFKNRVDFQQRKLTDKIPPTPIKI